MIDHKKWVEGTLAGMSLPQKVGQMMVADFPGVFTNRRHPNFVRIEKLVRDHHLGAFILAGGGVLDIAVLTNELQALAEIPLLVNADLETGCKFWHPWQRLHGRTPDLPANLTGGGTAFPTFMGIAATRSEAYAYEIGRYSAQEMRAIGIHWTNSPVLDVNSNARNPIVNTRSFGEEAELVARLGAAYTRGIQDGGVIATMKHFPGHGDTQQDTHMQLPFIENDLARLRQLELLPFKAAVEAGIKAAMTAHIALPRIDPSKRPATLSDVIINEVLRGELGFEGLITTDAMTMQAISDHFGANVAPVLAVKAGVDLVMMAPDCAAAIASIVQAVKDGEIPLANIDAAVGRILTAKAKLGLAEQRTVDIPSILETVNTPEAQALAEQSAGDAVTLLEHDGDTLPLHITGSSLLSLTVSNAPEGRDGSDLLAGLERAGAACQNFQLNADLPAEHLKAIRQAISGCDLVLLQLHLLVGAWRGELRLPPQTEPLLQEARKRGKKVIAVSFGDPYLFEFLPSVSASLCAYGTGPLLEQAMTRALTGQSAIHGKLPVTIPNRYPYGHGLELQAS